MRNETIGLHIKRLKLVKAAEYLKYSSEKSANIARSVGYADSATFSKAFKKEFECTPTSFREKHQLHSLKSTLLSNSSTGVIEPSKALPFEIRDIPEFKVLYCRYEGSYENKAAMQTLWDELISYAGKLNLLSHSTLYLGEILDDETITDDIHCRYNATLTLPNNTELKGRGKFKVKHILGGKFARFVHIGSHESCDDTYDRIYAQWMHHVGLEFVDRATLEFYRDNETVNGENSADAVPVTEILIPVARD